MTALIAIVQGVGSFLASDLVAESPREKVLRRIRATLLGIVAAISAIPDLDKWTGQALLLGSLCLSAVALLPRKTKRWAKGKTIGDFAITAVTASCVVGGSGSEGLLMASFWAFLLAAMGGATLDWIEAQAMP